MKIWDGQKVGSVTFLLELELLPLPDIVPMNFSQSLAESFVRFLSFNFTEIRTQKQQVGHNFDGKIEKE